MSEKFQDNTIADFRCFQCNKLLLKHERGRDSLEVKCLRCGHINPIFKGVDDQVILTDADGVILYVNPLVEDITGYSLQEVIGQKPSLWGGQMPTEFYKEMWQQIKGLKRPVVVKVKNKRKDGRMYEALLRISPVFDTSGDIKMFVGMETVVLHNNGDG